MTVSQLIKKLQKLPKGHRVAIANHDNDADELSGLVNDVAELEPGRMQEAYGPCIVLRP
ncbi:hypothetical protein [Phaeobacter gallaeciensis]|uniref:Uncharacterized protein n=1 Tax=Phaeobacter gallaeciensis TaxID=60890 RepID=A0AAD0EBA0_9RHOB|nr:hypothetical protein [Phaeobacter gallaeciensis]AHD09499.1 hypothetical protein Gal_01743 [Phaeobacter gallaeciensis DSM 26640]ATE92762.1 hypothetical protein PhaeoP11_01734 [Phaeobacter gallaeciensis]ATE97416.1 hypothetical protein PhaeoP73_02112 [Phaeobacter gallaeciensis]ATF01427.1 hypothetical protein PhaeoP75_01784 [Phaeobacter gallaeciensis]ATF05807.1 hypothetical protein PhaeoP63_01732 [Phaeobacter gallaeciensis]